MHVSALFVYPVKSLGGYSVSSVDVDDLGIVGDRRFLVVDPAGQFLTQRAVPAMALVRARIEGATLTLLHDTGGSISVPTTAATAEARRMTVTIWKSEGLLADDCGDMVATWLSDVLHTRCRLVRIGERFERPMLKGTAQPGDRVAFTDAYPFMVISEATLADLNDRLVAAGEEGLPMNRFRPSFVIAGAPAYAEDAWPRVKIGPIVFRAGGPCARCIVTTTNQETAERGTEPLRLLSTYRRDAMDPTRINFGQNLIHETKSATLRVGDAVDVLSGAPLL